MGTLSSTRDVSMNTSFVRSSGLMQDGFWGRKERRAITGDYIAGLSLESEGPWRHAGSMPVAQLPLCNVSCNT
jgi:hypothetical protein